MGNSVFTNSLYSTTIVTIWLFAVALRASQIVTMSPNHFPIRLRLGGINRSAAPPAGVYHWACRSLLRSARPPISRAFLLSRTFDSDHWDSRSSNGPANTLCWKNRSSGQRNGVPIRMIAGTFFLTSG
ncbi:hypothetical protein Pla52n_02550 [Stieleria varia]|uniref:Uncharacterized protein n=1 Tax=Stieleria varia TaxID=2528005 RepID=A0A5C6B7V3_9BACT|nr:hypothetical protein Pla52n_02550 [Stieleria varia]